MEENIRIDYVYTQKVVIGFIINYFNSYLFNQTKLSEIKEDFFTDNNLKEIFKYIKNRAKKHEIIDHKYLSEIIINNIPLLELSQEAKGVSNIRPYIDYMKQEFNNRLAEDMVKKGYKFSEWKNRLLSIDEPVELNSAYDEILKNIESINNNEESFKTGFNNIDTNKGIGFYRKTLNLIAGNSGMGKSTFALQLATNFAKNDKKILFFSQEMSRNELMNKILANEYNINSYRFLINEIKDEEKDNIEKTKKERLQYLDNIRFDYKPCITQEYINNIVKQYKPDIVFIDHLHIMGNSGKGENRNQELGTITADLKAIAKEQDCCIFLLSQLSRKDKKLLKKLDDYIPNLDDIRESGNIEANCDIIGFIFRPEYFLEKMIQGKTEEKEIQTLQEMMIKTAGKFKLLIKKNRNGICKQFNFNFYTAYSKFEEDEND